MRLVFAGTPEFARRALARLLVTRHVVTLVVTRPDQPAGHGLHPRASAVEQLALDHGLEVFQPQSLNQREALERLRDARPDLLVVAAYGVLLQPAVLEIAPLGAINIHASLLPRWRGAAPIQRALLAGDSHTGISIMKMDAGLDTGAVYEQRRTPIGPDDDAGTLHDRLAAIGAEALIAVLDGLEDGRAEPVAQPQAGVSYARKIDKAETWLDWTRSARELERAVRAFRPVPGAQTRLAGELLKIWRAAAVDGRSAPGTLAADGSLTVGCAQGALRITEVQRAGGRRMSAAEFLRGRALAAGTRFG